MHNLVMDTIVKYYGKPETWVNSMDATLMSAVFENTWSIEQGSARRIVFEYKDEVNLTWAVDADEVRVLQLWGNKAGSVGVAGLDFTYENSTNSYNLRNAQVGDVAKTLEKLEEYFLHAVYFPWSSIVEDDDIIEGSQLLHDSVSEGAVKLQEFIDETFDEPYDYTAILTLSLVGIKEHILPSSWENVAQKITYGDEKLIYNSPLHRFYEGITQLEGERKLVVDWDECCASCSRSFEVPDNMPSVILWGQNSQYCYKSDSSIELDLYADSITCSVLNRLIRKHDLQNVTVTDYGEE